MSEPLSVSFVIPDNAPADVQCMAVILQAMEQHFKLTPNAQVAVLDYLLARAHIKSAAELS